MNSYPIHQLTMPIHSILPNEMRLRGPVQDPPNFNLPFPAPANESEQRAIAVWINSHLIFFMSLNIATFAARNACIATKEADVASLTRWVDRLRMLRLASVAFTCTAANLTQELYSSDRSGTRDTFGVPAAKFSVPLVVNGKVFVATERSLIVFGLLQ